MARLARLVPTAPGPASGLRAALLLAALLVAGAALASASSTARAQSPPATYYGTATPGAMIEASIDGQSCGSTVAGSGGEWVLYIADTAATCTPVAGADVTFSIDGATIQQTFTWTPGGATEIAFGPDGTATTPTAQAPALGTPAPVVDSDSDGVDQRLDAIVVAVFVAVIGALLAFVGFQVRERRRSSRA